MLKKMYCYKRCIVKTTKNKPKPIIVKFVTHNDKDWVCYNKKKLKNQEYLITESLTSVRLQCMK